MSEPYTIGQISRALQQMQTPVLRRLDPHTFQRWPVRTIVPAKVIRELIDHEIAGRGEMA
jgi:hypothetical protein